MTDVAHIDLDVYDDAEPPPLRLVPNAPSREASGPPGPPGPHGPVDPIDLDGPPDAPAANGGGRGGRRRLRYALLALLGLATVWTPAVLYTLLAPDTYRSQWSILIPGAGGGSSLNLERLGQASTSVRSAYSSSAIDPKVNYKAIVSSVRVREDAARRSGVEPGDFPRADIRLIDQTAIIEATLEGASAEGARRHAESLHAALEAELERLRRTERERVEAGNLRQLEEYRINVDEAQRALLDFRADSRIASAGQYAAMIEDVGALERARDDAGVRLTALEARRAAIADALGLDPERAADVLRLQQDEILGSRLDSYAELHADYVAVASALGTEHPKVALARSRANGARSALERRAELSLGYRDAAFVERYVASRGGGESNLSGQLVAVQTEHAGVAAELAALDALAPRLQRRVRDSARHAATLQDLERSHQVAETIFLSTLARLDLGKSDVYASYPVTQLLVEPTLPDGPESIGRLLALAGALGGSFLVLLSLAISWNRDTLLRSLSRSA